MDFLLVYARAFVVGGLFCVIAQILIDKTALTPARILVGYVVAGVLLGAVGLYEPLMKFAGAGASTPLSGFGYAIAKGVKTAVAEHGILGVLGGGLGACTHVISAVLAFAFVASVFTKSKPK